MQFAFMGSTSSFPRHMLAIISQGEESEINNGNLGCSLVFISILLTWVALVQESCLNAAAESDHSYDDCKNELHTFN